MPRKIFPLSLPLLLTGSLGLPTLLHSVWILSINSCLVVMVSAQPPLAWRAPNISYQTVCLSLISRVEHSHWSRFSRYSALIGWTLLHMMSPRSIYAIITHLKACKMQHCLELCLYGRKELASATSESRTSSGPLNFSPLSTGLH